MTRQYLACAFRPGGPRYTYHFDHDETPAVVGDRMKVETSSELGWQTVHVAAIVDAPAFPTKPLLGFADLKVQLRLSLGGKE